MITPRQIYDVYPDSELLSFAPPRKDETYRAYRDRLGAGALKEDRLFHFLLAELCSEAIDMDEAQRRLDRAKSDLEHVQRRIV
jgi:hypothetical protein